MAYFAYQNLDLFIYQLSKKNLSIPVNTNTEESKFTLTHKKQYVYFACNNLFFKVKDHTVTELEAVCK